MKIIVCIKQVPESADVKPDAKTNTLKRASVEGVINPDDLTGIEEALLLKEKTGGSVTVITMGPPAAEEALREALAMGCDEAILITDKALAGSDTWATAAVLSAAIEKEAYDLIIAGQKSSDGDTAQVGPQIAENLKLPQVTNAAEVSLEGSSLIIKQRLDGKYYRIKAETPCLITVLSSLASPRYMTVSGIKSAYEKEIKRLSLEDLKDKVSPEEVGLLGSPTLVEQVFAKKAKASGEIINLTPDEAVKVIVSKLAENHII